MCNPSWDIFVGLIESFLWIFWAILIQVRTCTLQGSCDLIYYHYLPLGVSWSSSFPAILECSVSHFYHWSSSLASLQLLLSRVTISWPCMGSSTVLDVCFSTHLEQCKGLNIHVLQILLLYDEATIHFTLLILLGGKGNTLGRAIRSRGVVDHERISSLPFSKKHSHWAFVVCVYAGDVHL